MTLHLAFTCPAFVIQVGDRMLTTTGRDGSAEPWDVASNKTIVLWGPGGLVTISYAGAAFIDGVHTDEWLVDTIFGVSNGAEGILQSPPRVPMHRYAPGPAWAAIHEAVDDRFPRQSSTNRANGLEVMMTGWSWKRRSGRGRTLTRVAQWSRFDRRLVDMYVEQNLRYPVARQGRTGWRVTGIGAVHHAEVVERAGRDFPPGTMITPDIAERHLVDAIRDAAAEAGGYIGTDLMAVRQLPDEPLRVRYLPDPAAAPLYAYSPWHVSPIALSPPEIITGVGQRLIRELPDGSEITMATHEVDPPLPRVGTYMTAKQQRRRL